MVTRGDIGDARTSIQVSREVLFWLKGVVLRREQQTGHGYTYDSVIREMLKARDDDAPLLFPDVTPEELNATGGDAR